MAPTGDIYASAPAALGRRARPRPARRGLGGRARGDLLRGAVRVRPKPAAPRFEAWSFPSFADGIEALRRAGAVAARARTSPASPTPRRRGSTFAQAGGGAAVKALRGYRRCAGTRNGCLAILGWDGDEDIATRRRTAAACSSATAPIPLGPAPGKAWAHGRFRGALPARHAARRRGHGRDARDGDDLVAGSKRLHGAVAAALRGALEGRGTPPVVLLPRLPPLSRRAPRCTSRSSRRAAPARSSSSGARPRHAASDAIVAAGGDDHPPPRGRRRPRAVAARPRWGRRACGCSRAAKRELDPAGILNPGQAAGAAEATDGEVGPAPSGRPDDARRSSARPGAFFEVVIGSRAR